MKGLKGLVLLALLIAAGLAMFAPAGKANAGASACATATATSVQMLKTNGFRKGLICQNVGASVTGYLAIGTANTCVGGTAGNAFALAPGVVFEESTGGCQGSSSCVPTGDISICTASSVTTICCAEW
jgi:hypothetical protein